MSEVDSPIVETSVPEQPAQQGQPLDLNKDLNTGFVVGLTKEGAFLFQVLGAEPGLAELMGLLEHARERVRVLYSSKQVTSDALAVRMLNELGQMVNSLDQKVSRLAAKLDPKPENKL